MTRDSKETMRHGERRKFTQTARSLPARAAGARMRLVFALISVTTLLATMFVTGPFQARVAEAAEAGICKPSTGTIGDGNGPKTDSDDGVATWVGRDMYVGAPSGSNTSYNSSTKPEQSYAVEAEGLTVVQGKLAMHGVKGQKYGKDNADGVDNANFNGHGFRFGTVGFGANLRPVPGSDVIVVGGIGSNIRLTDNRNNDVNVLAWGNAARGYVRSDSLGPGHRISIAGEWSKAYEIDQNDNYDNLERGDNIDYTWVNEGTVFNFDDHWNRPYGSTSEVRWGVENPLASVKLNTNDDAKMTSLSGYQSVIENTSKVLKARPATAEGVASTAPAQSGFSRQNYGNANYKVTFNFGDENSNTPKERLITFTGNGTRTDQVDSATGAYKVTDGSVMQVFTLDASLLDNAGTNGISFRFDNIPEYASVVINVVGDYPVDFNNGWRFWWNGAEISNYYTVFNQDNKQARNELYSHAASAIMWNFADVTSKVTVRGGQITNGQNGQVENTRKDGQHYSQKVGGAGQVQITDDPVANMLGSVLVPNGSFETHVSTNGRVWVGKDYMMYNPTGLKELAYLNGFDSNGWHEPISASVIEQDQERHNFGWHGEISDACAVLEWSKVDSDGNALAGTEWAIYASKEAAMRHDTTAALVTVLDDGHDDWAIGTKGQGVGKFQVRRLNPNATYYLREISAPAGYAVNSNIYQINTGNGNQTENDIDQVVDGGFIKPSTAITATFDLQGNSATNDLLWTTDESTYGKRVVNMELPSVEWEKVNKEDTSELLPDSRWSLSRKANANAQDYTVTVREELLDFAESVNEHDTLVYLEQPSTGWPSDSKTVPSISYCAYLPTSNTAETCNGQWPYKTMTSLGSGIWVAVINTERSNQDTSLRKKLSFSFFASGNGNYHATGTSGSTPFVVEPETKFATVYKLDNKPAVRNEQLAYVDTNPILGKFDIKYLEPGAYRLTETQAPEGFWLPANPDHTFTVADGGGSAGLVAKWDGDASAGVKAISNTPTKVVWEKVDSDDRNQYLSGSTWTLMSENGSSLATVSDCVSSSSCETGMYRDQDNEAGKFMLKRLPAGTYKLQEATAPAGYQKSDAVYTFTILPSEPNPAEVKVTANPIGNTRKPGEVTWEKIAQKPQRQHKQGQVDDPDTPVALSEAENHQLLAGSEWKFEYTPYQAASGTQPTTLTIKDCMPADNGSGDVNCTAINDSYS